jgi:hypothetical protein
MPGLVVEGEVLPATGMMRMQLHAMARSATWRVDPALADEGTRALCEPLR